MKFKNIIFSLTIFVTALPMAIFANDEEDKLKQASDASFKVYVHDLTDYVPKQEGNTCGTHSAMHGKYFFDVLSDNTNPSLEQAWQTYKDCRKIITQEIEERHTAALDNDSPNPLSTALDGDQVREVADSLWRDNPENVTVIESFEQTVEGFNNGRELPNDQNDSLFNALIRLKRLNSETIDPLPHVFLIGTMNKNTSMGHWVTCVAQRAHDGIHLYYADSKNPGEASYSVDSTLNLTSDQLAQLIQNNEKIHQDIKLEIIERQRNFTGLMKELLNKDPFTLRWSELNTPLNSMENVLNVNNDKPGALKHLRKALEEVTNFDLFNNENFKYSRFKDRLHAGVKSILNIEYDPVQSSTVLETINESEAFNTITKETDDSELQDCLIRIRNKLLKNRLAVLNLPEDNLLEIGSDDEESASEANSEHSPDSDTDPLAPSGKSESSKPVEIKLDQRINDDQDLKANSLGEWAKERKNKNHSWFSSLTSWFTPKTTLVAVVLTAGVYVLHTILSQHGHTLQLN